ncbi:hypothetical protein DCAR_0729206 [Daucus carota subsp. sativus]|uniref:C3H1-type domain-containing protein n=1 Tax=Daucus carota subsp. sativus TaxID=79200 RepID=A0AAF0XKK8_DAUCS|nr:hypothetical protein DCAR_0729206 [Daucus carota subsp. sativus]
MKGGGEGKDGSKWSEIENEGGDRELEGIKNEAEIKERNSEKRSNWDDGAVRAKANQERQCFDNYENERDINDKGPHWYRNPEKDSGSSNDENFGSLFVRTGTCRFGSNCKFNHPLERKNQASRDAFKQKEEIYDEPRQTECKYYLSAGGCKYRKACWYSHGKGKSAVTPNSELNFIGFPIRVWRFSNKLFHHPNPTAAGGLDTTPRRIIYPPTPSAPENAEWNGYQGILPIPPALSMTIPATGSSFYAHPGPDCSSYLRTGNYKFRSSCRFHHPRNWRRFVCSHFCRYGTCKFGSSCKYDHSAGGTAFLDGADHGRFT